jgi:hypothetical protein
VTIETARIMALLIESLQRHQYIRVEYVTPPAATLAEVREVMRDAGMVPVGAYAWTPGYGTHAWLCKWLGK